MIPRLAFTKTKQIQDTIEHALQSNPKEKVKLDRIKEAKDITLEDAVLVVNLLNQHHSHDHKHYVHEMLSGSSIYKPPPKITQNPKFAEYLKSLRAKQAKRDYQKLISGHKVDERHKSLKDVIKAEQGTQQWLDWSSIGHVIMLMVGSFLVFYYVAHHLWPHSRESKLVAGCVGLLLGLFLEFILMVVREQKAELEEASTNPSINMKLHHERYNKKSVQKVLDAQKQEAMASKDQGKVKES